MRDKQYILSCEIARVKEDCTITVKAISRRRFLKWAATSALTLDLLRTGNALTLDDEGSTPPLVNSTKQRIHMTKPEIIRAYYSGWEKKDWQAVSRVLADNFTFTSPNDDDHINVHIFKTKCWPQADYVQRFDLEIAIGQDNDAFVKTLCVATNGKSIENVEYFRFADGQVTAIECYFGSKLGYPSKTSSNR
jgi:hypothetical protein